MHVHPQIPPSHGVAEYNYFPSPAQNSFTKGQFQPQHQVNYNLTSAFIVSPEVVVDHAWYADSGVSSQVTANLSKFLTYTPYFGGEKLVVGSGDQLDISHIGSVIVCSHSIPIVKLKLDGVLHVPRIAKNLLGISRFTVDNNALAEFVNGCCLIKDKDSKKVLLRGTLKDGLYQLHLSGFQSCFPTVLSNTVTPNTAAFVSACNPVFVKNVVVSFNAVGRPLPNKFVVHYSYLKCNDITL
ncbi:hypothetical protein ACOSP7_031575 [Xanthoceras sorbifolium]